MDKLLGYGWPGNVRELRNVIRRAALLADESIGPEHLAVPDASPGAALSVPLAGPDLDGRATLKEIVRRSIVEVERRVLVRVLRETGGNKAKAARVLHIDYKTMHTKVKEYGISI